MAENQQISIKTILILVIIASILRLPSLFEPHWYGDEGIYLVIGSAIRNGQQLYLDIFDNKPPAIYLLASLTSSLAQYRFLLYLWHLSTIILFYRLSLQLLTDKKAQLFSNLLFIFLTSTPFIEGNVGNAEIFMLLPTIAGLVVLIEILKQNNPTLYLLPGFLIGISFLFKFPAVFDLLAMCFVISLLDFNKTRLGLLLKKLFSLLSGFLIPVGITAIFFVFKDALPSFIFSSYSYNFKYVSVFKPPTIFLIPLNLAARTFLLFILCLVFALRKKALKASELFIGAWFLFVLFGVLLSSRNYPHYLIQLAPAVSLLMAMYLFSIRLNKILATSLIIMFIGSMSLFKFEHYPVVGYYGNYLAHSVGIKSEYDYKNDFDPATMDVELAGNFVKRSLSDDDTVFVVGNYPYLYDISGRLPPLPYITSFQINDLSSVDELDELFSKNPPTYVIDADRNSLNKEFSLLVTNYIYREYKPIKKYSNVIIWKSKTLINQESVSLL